MICFVSFFLALFQLHEVRVRCEAFEDVSLGMGIIEKCIKPGMVALTFDDGISEYTAQLLKILRSEGVSATFFVQGETIDPARSNWKRHREILKNVWRAGHDVGSHSYDHPSFPSISVDEIASQMIRTDEFLTETIGVSPRMMRLPYGDYTPSVIRQLQEMDYKVIQWNIDSDDWKLEHNPPPYLAEHVAHMIPPRDHSREGSYIILEHDTYRYTVANQVDIIRGLKSKGYRLVSMTECLGTTKLYKRRKIIEAEVEDEHRIEYEDIFESYNTSV